MDESLLRELGFSPRLLQKALAALNEYVDAEQIPGYSLAICRKNQVPFITSYGFRNIKAKAAFTPQTIVRAASLSKPIFSVLLLILVEQGLCKLDDVVSSFIPEVAEMKVLVAGSDKNPEFEALSERMTIHHLLSHQSGLGYDYNVPAKLRAEFETAVLFDMKSDTRSLATRLCKLPLLFQPGKGFQYGLSTDLLGCVIAEICQKPLDKVLHDLLLSPLGMQNTGFYLAAEKQIHVAELYKLASGQKLTVLDSEMEQKFNPELKMFSAGGGLLSTLDDYINFTQLLLGQGEYNGRQLLPNELFQKMVRNHMDPTYAPWEVGRNVKYDTVDYGFGYNLKVLIDNSHKDFPIHKGEYGWAGACNSYLWVEPNQEYAVLLFSHWLPFAKIAIDPEIKKLIYQAYLI